MADLPAVRGAAARRAFEKAGFEFARQKGSHVVLKRASPPCRITIPIHAGQDLKKGLLLGLIKDAGLTLNEFLELL